MKWNVLTLISWACSEDNKGKSIRLAYRHQVFVSRIMTVEEPEWVLGPLTPTEDREPFFILQCAGRKRRHHILLWAW